MLEEPIFENAPSTDEAEGEAFMQTFAAFQQGSI